MPTVKTTSTPGPEKCAVETCRANAAQGCRGMCMKCYSSARKRVKEGFISWEQLEDMGLAKPEPSAFDREIMKKLKERGDGG
jgi:hypothetical protein